MKHAIILLVLGISAAIGACDTQTGPGANHEQPQPPIQHPNAALRTSANPGELHHAFLQHFAELRRSGALEGLFRVPNDAMIKAIASECFAFFRSVKPTYPCEVDFEWLARRVDQFVYSAQLHRSDYQSNSESAGSPERLQYYYDELGNLTGQDLPTAQYDSAVTVLQDAAIQDPELTELENYEFWEAGEVAKDSHQHWNQEASYEPYFDPQLTAKPFWLWLACIFVPEKTISYIGADIFGSAFGSAAWVAVNAGACFH